VKASKIGLLILVLGFGGAVETAWSVRQNIGFGPQGCRVLAGRFYGSSFSFDAGLTQPVPAGTAIEVVNAFGGVTVRAGDPGQVKIALRKVVFRPTEEQARAFANQIRIDAAVDGGVLRVGTNRDELENRAEGREVGFETHFEVTVPPATAVTVRNEHGRVEVADAARADITSSFDEVRLSRVSGAARIQSRHGDVLASTVGGDLSLVARHGRVEVQDVQGGATVDSEHGDVSATRTGGLVIRASFGEVGVEGVRGDLEVRSQHGPVTARNVSGAATIEGSFGDALVEKAGGDARITVAHGAIDAADVVGGVVAETSFGDVVLARVGGPVQVKVAHGGVKARALEKGAQISASGADVVIDGFRGEVRVEVERGGVSLAPAGALTDPVWASAAQGAVRLEVPAGSRFVLDATAEPGEVQVDVPGLVVTSTTAGAAKGEIGGGGSSVHLQARHGDVRVQAAATAAAKNP
jgi:putative adhesin